MKKANLFAASIAAMSLVGCTSEDYVGVVDNPTGDGIGFGSGVTATTRANSTGSQAAEKLNNNFIVYGFKTTAAEAATNTNDKVVFDLYNVNYAAGTAGTTESNTRNWEYVGFTPHTGSSATEQSIKYWDFSANEYVFSAVSGIGITAEKIVGVSTTSKYDKGWTVKIPAGGDISTLYASDRKVVEKAQYKNTVELTFRSLITKIRFAMYEVIPGYEVHIDKFYYKNESWKNTETNFAIDGTFKTTNKDGVTPLTITYYDNASGIENRPKVSYTDAEVTSAKYGIFGANIQATSAIGTTSAGATYDQSDKSYTWILPYESSSLATPEENILELYVDYTLTSTDGSGEKIKVYHASAKVPSNFAQWKPNFAYTYIFKISDNSNGSTVTPGTGGYIPDDPTTKPDVDKVGLFPITFDAVVITDETDVQETITSVSDPSVTTYQEGVVVTNNDEYVAGDIYFESLSGISTTSDVSNYHVYEVNNYGSEVTTEEVVANWLKNFCVLTEVDVTLAPGDGASGAANFIPLSNGTFIQKKANEAAKFTAVAGKTYIITDQALSDAEPVTPAHYKVVKVAGAVDPGDTFSPTASASANQTITSADGTSTFTVKNGTYVVYGAKAMLRIYHGTTDLTQYFTVTEIVDTDGNLTGDYSIALTDEGIANGKYPSEALTVKLVNSDGTEVVATSTQTLTVSQNALTNAATTIIAGKSADVIFKFNGTAWGDADKHAVVVNNNKGITVEAKADGVFTISVASDVAAGNYTMTIGGVTETVTVGSYAFTSDLVITKALTGTSTGTLTLQKNGATATGITTLTGSDDDIATFTAADGVYTFTAVAGGSFEVTYENAKANVTVNAYTIATPAYIKKSTGSAVIEVKCNGETINAATASLECTAKPDVLYADEDEYNTAKGGGSALDADEFAALPYADKVKTPAVYTVSTNGKTIKFSGASIAGAYEFDYKVGTTVVAHVVITVNP